MKSDKTDQSVLTRYLLGELSEAESLEIEQRCLDDDQTFEQLEAIEAELTDDYVRGVLGGRRRKQFEKRILNAPRGPGKAKLADLELAKLIAGPAAGQRSPIAKLKAWIKGHSFQPWLLRTASVVATLVVAISIGWFSLERRSPESSPQAQLAKSAAPANQASVQPSAVPSRENPPPDFPANLTRPAGASVKPPLIATFLLTPEGVRGGGEDKEISIPTGAKKVRFRIELATNEYPSYDVSLSRVEGERLFIQNNVKPRPSKAGVTLVIELPATVVPVGTSFLTLTGAGQTGAPQTVRKYVVRVSDR